MYFIIVSRDREHLGELWRVSVIRDEDELNARIEDGSLQVGDGDTIYRGEVYGTIKETKEVRKLELIRKIK